MSVFENFISSITGGDLLGKLIVAIVLVCADIFTLKHVSKTKQQPKPHTMPRIILMKIELWGMEVSSRCIIWRSHFTNT